MKIGGNGLNMGLGRNFFSDGKGNHRISGIQSIPSKTGLIDSSSFVLEKRLAWAGIVEEERNMGLARIISSSSGRASPIQTFEIQHTSNFNFEASIFNFEASILIYQVLHLFRSWQCQTSLTRGGK